MFALGCIQALQCNENTCPTGITTHNPKLQKGLDPTVKSTRVANYATSMHEEVRLIAHSCGVLDPRALSAKHAFIISAQGAAGTDVGYGFNGLLHSGPVSHFRLLHYCHLLTKNRL